MMPEESSISEEGRSALEELAAVAGGNPAKARELADEFTHLLAIPDDPEDIVAVHDALLRVFMGRANPMDFVVGVAEAEQTGPEILREYQDFRVIWHVITLRLKHRVEELGDP